MKIKPKSEMKPKAKQALCPMCGLERDAKDAHLYECPSCGRKGFDCCVAGTNCVCVDCEGD